MLTVLFEVGVLDCREVAPIPVSTHKATDEQFILETALSIRIECLVEQPRVTSWPVQNAVQNVEENVVLGRWLAWSTR